MSAIHTQDGTFIINDPDVGTVTGRNQQEAEAEVRRLKALSERYDGGLNIVTKHSEIQSGRAA